MLFNALYHSAVVPGIAAGYARLGKMAMGGSLPKLDFRDVGMLIVDVALAMVTKDMLRAAICDCDTKGCSLWLWHSLDFSLYYLC